MAQFELKVPLGVSEKELLEYAQGRVRQASRQYLDDMFHDGRYRDKPGAGYLIMRDAIDNYICSDEAAAKIQAIIDKNWESLLEAAVLKALEHKANKMAFTRVREKLPLPE